MSRRSKWLAVLLLIGGFCACLGLLGLLVKREPAFYLQATCPDDWETRENSAKLITRVQDLKNEIRSKGIWGGTFTAYDLNCFFTENMGQQSGLCEVLPNKTHSPRVAIEGDRLKFGFRYGAGFWSTVIWVELKVWLVANEVNLVAVEVCDLRFGNLPIGSQSILDSITEGARDKNIEVTWYRNGRNPVGLFRFYADQPRPSSQILTLEVKDGKIVIAGQTFIEPTPSPPAGVNSWFRDPGGE